MVYLKINLDSITYDYEISKETSRVNSHVGNGGKSESCPERFSVQKGTKRKVSHWICHFLLKKTLARIMRQ